MTRPDLGAGIGLGGPIAVSTPAPRPPARPTVRVLGVDPGATIGWCVLDVGDSTGSYVSAGAVRAGAHGLGDDARSLLESVLAGARAIILAIERVEHVHGQARMGSSYAEGLARAGWVGGEIAQLGRARGLEVATVEAAVWRKLLVGSRTAKDAQIAAMVRVRIPTWPKRSNAHTRDAAGVALWAGLRPWGAS